MVDSAFLASNRDTCEAPGAASRGLTYKGQHSPPDSAYCARLLSAASCAHPDIAAWLGISVSIGRGEMPKMLSKNNA
jgi:hypothetical protein